MSDRHAIIIIDVDIHSGKIHYSAHSNERMNRNLSEAFKQDNPEEHMCIVKSNYWNVEEF